MELLCAPFQLLNKITDFHEIRHARYATRYRHNHVNIDAFETKF
jgi:hypothetical protein